ncbi:hypothetical protein P154DRAFT_366846 [Amniculicola lignicola CBS 123094]|uniref:Uncharacterized protein n=1 Tax=Amniculicola lignicola CBS 123094 TaxID=1392246 RepID=A0A6A5W0J9_9PLEO|nr:hypothetical protein P154DRAFT_366846 [Amniculicola lignicola CBS 123094]
MFRWCFWRLRGRSMFRHHISPSLHPISTTSPFPASFPLHYGPIPSLGRVANTIPLVPTHRITGFVLWTHDQAAQWWG